MVKNDDYETNLLKLETLEATIKALIEEHNKLSPSVHSIKLGLVSGYDGDLAKNLRQFTPNADFNFDPEYSIRMDNWYSSGCSF